MCHTAWDNESQDTSLNEFWLSGTTHPYIQLPSTTLLAKIHHFDINLFPLTGSHHEDASLQAHALGFVLQVHTYTLHQQASRWQDSLYNLTFCGTILDPLSIFLAQKLSFHCLNWHQTMKSVLLLQERPPEGMTFITISECVANRSIHQCIRVEFPCSIYLLPYNCQLSIPRLYHHPLQYNSLSYLRQSYHYLSTRHYKAHLPKGRFKTSRITYLPTYCTRRLSLCPGDSLQNYHGWQNSSHRWKSQSMFYWNLLAVLSISMTAIFLSYCLTQHQAMKSVLL